MPSDVATGSGVQSVEDLRRDLAEAREQQAATAGILAAIRTRQRILTACSRRSPRVQPNFATPPMQQSTMGICS